MEVTQMATSIFKEKVYPTLKDGKYQVKLGKIVAVSQVKDGELTEHIEVPMTFENGRIETVRWSSKGIYRFNKQLLTQLNIEDVMGMLEFFKFLENREVTVWITSSSYVANDGTVQPSSKYDFVEPVTVETACSDKEI
jgi:hypothetical protein